MTCILNDCYASTCISYVHATHQTKRSEKKIPQGFHGFIDKGTPGLIYTSIILKYLKHRQCS